VASGRCDSSADASRDWAQYHVSWAQSHRANPRRCDTQVSQRLASDTKLRVWYHYADASLPRVRVEKTQPLDARVILTAHHR
jgi:hypothetical protein